MVRKICKELQEHININLDKTYGSYKIKYKPEKACNNVHWKKQILGAVRLINRKGTGVTYLGTDLASSGEMEQEMS